MDCTRGAEASPATPESAAGIGQAPRLTSLQPQPPENTIEAFADNHSEDTSDESPLLQSQPRVGSKRTAQELDDASSSIRKRRPGRPRTVERDENDVPLYRQSKGRKAGRPPKKQPREEEDDDDDERLPDPPHMPPDAGTSPFALQEILSGQPCMNQYERLRDFWVDEAHWTELDDKILAQSTTNNSARRSLWQIMWQVFSAPLTDLFRFGLVIDASTAWNILTIRSDSEASAKYHHPYVTLHQTEKMRELALHPVWEGRIDVFRHVLMWSVRCSIEDHDDSLEPIKPLDRLITNETHSKSDMAAIAYRNTKQNGIRSQPVIDRLCRKLKALAKPRPAVSIVEKQLFMLSGVHLTNVIKALDCLLHLPTKANLWPPTSSFYADWKKDRPPPATSWPRKVTDVDLMKKAFVQRMRMESACRDFLTGTGTYLYDIGGAYCSVTATCYDDIKADELEGPTQSQLDVVRGLVMPPFGAYLPASQWRINEVESSTNTPTNLDSSVSRSRVPSAARTERHSSANDEGSTLPATPTLSQMGRSSTHPDRRPLHQEDGREVIYLSSSPAQSSASRDESVGPGHQQEPQNLKATVTSSEIDRFLKSEDKPPV